MHVAGLLPLGLSEVRTPVLLELTKLMEALVEKSLQELRANDFVDKLAAEKSAREELALHVQLSCSCT